MIPLNNIKVIELAGLAPVPLCGMILSDFGAKVIRVDNYKQNIRDDILNRGKKSIFLDLKQDNQRNMFKKLLKQSDVLLDPYRPGVLEKLNLAPIDLQKENPGLVIARLTGYGQPRLTDSKIVSEQKLRAGHDINYIALSGVLSRFGSVNCDTPQFPMNILGDFAGGGLSCAFGVVLALLNRERTGLGEVIDASMTLGISYLSSFIWRTRQISPLLWPNPEIRGCNTLDGGAPFYRCYRTSDNKYLAIGALEPQFYACLLKVLEIPESEAPQFDFENWPQLSVLFSNVFITKTQKEWIDKGHACGDCCLTPVLELDEAAKFWTDSFSQNEEKFEPKRQPILDNLKEMDEQSFKRPKAGENTEEVLTELGCSREEIDSIFKLTSKI